ncbi:MAG: hypothetical protein ACD_41C00365G0007 [uncultured bacterium]|nr:MAG: hypothetical protein ACD_41C00365G0007 [uncultured bacterium]HBY73114.1 hypothetical protein [Candidatus Kerfeldbacteria bacterium]
MITSKQPGYILVTLIVFGAMLIMVIGAIVNLLILQHRTVQRSVASESALQIAEAGANYYRWVLAHDPENYTGADQDYYNANGDNIGHYLVTVTGPTDGSTVVTIESTAWTHEYPLLQRTLRVRYGKPSYAEYAFLTNSNVWFGPGEEVHGRLHSNGGIRMDGIVDSLATSIKETYICGPEHGCADEEKPGIWGDGEDPALWSFPIADAIDFDSISLDFEDMETAAGEDGILFDNIGGKGVHIVFNSDGTFTAYKVTSLQSNVWGHDGTSWTYESNDIKNETTISGYVNHALPDNGIIFVDDQTWVSGQVNGRVTVAAAHLPESDGITRDIIIDDDVTYYPDRASGSVLGVMAQEDILVPLYAPADLVVDAALLGQNGQVMRYYYPASYYPADAVKTHIETYGTLVTNDLWTWSWVDGSGTIISGYQTTSTNYDPDLYYAPPPYFPTQDDYTFISWEEVNQ